MGDAEVDGGAAALLLALDELSWARAAVALLCAVLLPLILHRIFYHKRARLDSSVGSGSLEDYMLKVSFHLIDDLRSDKAEVTNDGCSQ